MIKSFKGEICDWSDLKDKPFKILLSDLDFTIKLLRKIGYRIEKDKIGYWLCINHKK